MRQFHVQVFYQHVKGSHSVARDESYITFATTYTVNGMFVDNDWADLRFTPFGELWLTLPPPPSPGSQRSDEFFAPYVAFYEALTPEDCLWGSDFNFVPGVMGDKTRGIPVSTVEFIEGNWFEHVRAA